MTTPSGIIDADLPVYGTQDYFFVLDTESVWRATNVRAAGAATWEEIYTAAEFETAESKTGCKFTEIRCAYQQQGLIYVLGYCNSGTAGKTDSYIFRSIDYGSTWKPYLIAEQTGEDDSGLTIVDVGDYDGNIGAGSVLTIEADSTTITHTLDLSDIPFPYSERHREIILSEPLDAAILTITFDVDGDCYSKQFDTDGDQPIKIDDISGSWSGSAPSWSFDGTIDYRFYTEEERSILRAGYFYGYDGRWEEHTSPDPPRTAVISNIVIDGVAITAGSSNCFDVSRTNNNWLYVGTKNSIYKSEDGGETWEILYPETPTDNCGAEDICVDPLLAGVIYYWGVDRNFYSMIDGQRSASLLTETAGTGVNKFKRIICDPLRGGYQVWTFEHTGSGGTAVYSLKRRLLGSWTDLQTSVNQAGSLRAYPDATTAGAVDLIWVTGGEVYYSNDGGVTTAEKSGAWTPLGCKQFFLYQQDYT